MSNVKFQMSNVVLKGCQITSLTEWLPNWCHTYALLIFLKSGDFSGHFKEVMGNRGQTSVKCGSKGCQ